MAVNVLDRCMELAPHSVLPYDQFIAGMTFPRGDRTIHHEGVIEAYYMCGETEKANAILVEYSDILNQRVAYFNSLKPKTRASVEQDQYEVMAQMEELKMLLGKFGQQDKLLELGF